MNKRQKLVQEQFINNEEAVIKRLKSVYKQSQKDIETKAFELQSQINSLDAMIGMTEDAEKLEKLLSMKQSKVYQKQYQDALKKQVNSILDNMQVEEFKTISEYLNKCYEDGFIGTMFDLQGQGIPLCFPLDQEALVRAVQIDSKINQGLYARLGEDVSMLKKKITAQVSRGISTGMSFEQVAQQLSGYTKIGYNNAIRIARTEGHRIQTQGTMDACYKAKEKGADVVKQWDATMDSATRESHTKVDGEIREVDEKFSNGLMFPGDPSGGASEVVNCRCALLQRARWALDEAELETLKERAAFFGLDKAEQFDDYKQKYLKTTDSPLLEYKPAKTIDEATEFAQNLGVKYVRYDNLPLDTANNMNKALLTLPDDARPIFVGDSKTLEAYWGGSLPRTSKGYYGVTIRTHDGIHLGYGKGWVDTDGYMVGISSSYKTSAKITASKAKSQIKYQEKYNGRKWFFNENGETTAFHEMGHVYANTKGIPNGFEQDAIRWAKESGCDMLKKTSEAWAEAWGAYHTNNQDLPEYIAKYIKSATSNNIKASKALKILTDYDDNVIMMTEIQEFTKKLQSGKISTVISKQKQSRHILSSKEFKTYSEKLAKNGDCPAYIKEDLSFDDLAKIVKDKLGTGIVEIRKDGSVREFFDCDDIVGMYYDKTSGSYKPTKRVQISYAIGDGNIHIIPVKEK